MRKPKVLRDYTEMRLSRRQRGYFLPMGCRLNVLYPVTAWMYKAITYQKARSLAYHPMLSTEIQEYTVRKLISSAQSDGWEQMWLRRIKWKSIINL